jgi:2-C-methyl-D-erythritol 4-phosphate cytidylyltransferase
MVESGNSRVPKPLVKINSQPIIIYCLKIISKHPSIRDIVVVVNAQIRDKIIKAIKRYRISKIIQVVRGGRRRQDSVHHGLGAIDERTDLVLIHDGVRPFITKGIITSVIKKAKDTGAAIVGVPVKATIKEIAYRKSHIANRIIVKKTLDRNSLWEIQTPQVFRKDLILRAYEKFGNADVTDDAMLVEKLGTKVGVVLGSYDNIKITTPEDLRLAEAILECHTE